MYTSEFGLDMEIGVSLIPGLRYDRQARILVTAAVFLSTLGNCAYISNMGSSPLISKTLRSSNCQQIPKTFGTWNIPTLRKRCFLAASMSAAGTGPKPINIKPSKHDIATGRDPTRLKVYWIEDISKKLFLDVYSCRFSTPLSEMASSHLDAV